ncbi:hypothetical protein A2V47_01025 [Candidatus Atribacteria bacterium RBG_19FT_COMBO_35_14]|uniref:DUF3048 domain-containing protein n=1 Tax=Candidatus Sediminicultor quintus TaxID=1797291 RepID=A0A1F5ADF1_9BACT|nr:MAG: hypothetical protein A2V47_01025 [Candidatus Atribacteria bacterium RBG_19FT_COMBO_35_14]
MPIDRYRTKRLKQSKKSFLGRSFLISIILNIILLFAFGNMIAFDFTRPLPEKELILVSLVEIPAPEQPESKKPEITEKKPVAQLEVIPKATPASPEPPKIKEEITETKVVSKEELTEGAPKVEVKTPEIETEPVSIVPPTQTKDSLGEDISVSTEYFKQTISSREEVKGEIFEPGESQLKVNLGEKEEENIEATYGTVVNPGEITTLPEVKEKESPFGSRPLSIMVENAEGARPQSGLDKANIVYEVLAEGGITRFLAIYYDQEAEEVGPVRSARPYFVSKSLEHQAIFVHVGGSEEAYNFIKQESIDDINEFVDFQPFWRSTDRTPPHNLYTSTINLRKEANKLGYIEMIKKQEYQFEISRNEKLTGRETDSIVIPYNRNYTVSYQYQPESMKYIRFINGEPHIDAKTKKQLAVDNIIIQFAETKIIDQEGRLAIDFVSKGIGLLFLKGNSTEITWGKADLRARTVFLDKEGNRIALTPGNVWIQIVPSDLTVQY